MTAHTNTVTLSISQRIAAGLVAILLGSALLYTVGFAPMAGAHNAAHDTRHGLGFPCH
jgi:cobalt transporter subunit CbtB